MADLDLSQISLGALLSDDEHKQRLQALVDQLAAIKTATEASEQAAAAQRATLDQVRQERAGIEDAKANLAAREAKLKADTASLAGAIETMTREKAAFGTVREREEARLREWDSELGTRKAALDQNESAVRARSMALMERETAAAATAAKFQKAREHAAAFIGAIQ